MPDSTLDQLRDIGQQIRTAEAEGADRKQLLPMWARRRELVHAAREAEYRKADIARALNVTRQNVDRLLAA